MINRQIGFCSETQDGKHIILWDFDCGFSKINNIIIELSRIQKEYKLSEIYIIQSKNGFNAICLTKCSKEECFHIKQDTFKSDSVHNSIGLERNNWVLRIGEDKAFRQIIRKDAVHIWQKSNAHRLLLNNYYNLKIAKDLRFDNYSFIKFESW